jgi:hypothetical protein
MNTLNTEKKFHTIRYGGDWLFIVLLFYVPLKNISLTRRRHHYRWRAVKFRPMLGAQGLWARRDLYRATRTSVFSVISEGPPHSVASCNTQGGVEDLFSPGSSLVPYQSPFMKHLGCGRPILTRIYTWWYGGENHILFCIRNVNHWPLGSTPPPRNKKLAEYLENYWDPYP